MRLTPAIIEGITKDKTGKHYFADQDDTYKTIVDNLKSRTPFAFSRWGDGEINAVLGKKGSNCDGHEYFVNMGLKLRAILYNDQPYMMAVGPLAAKIHHAVLPDIDWHNAAALADASIKDGMKDFFEVLRMRQRKDQVVTVGHEALVMLNFSHIWTPPEDAWLSYPDTLTGIRDYCHRTKDAVVLLCCGMMSGVMLHELYKEGVTVIDAGSVLDPYVKSKVRQAK